MKTDNNIEIVKCVLIDIDDNTESVLFEREDKHCHFHEDIEYRDYIIQLRLDWHDIKNNEPVLDADIYRKPKSSRTKLSIMSSPWHHTEKTFDSEANGHIYTFEFEGLRLRLTNRKTMAISLPSDACIVNDNLDIKVKKKE